MATAKKTNTTSKKTTKKGSNDRWKTQGALVPVDISKVTFANKPKK